MEENIRAPRMNDKHGDRYDMLSRAFQGTAMRREMGFTYPLPAPLRRHHHQHQVPHNAPSVTSGPFGIHRSISSVIHYNPKSITYYVWIAAILVPKKNRLRRWRPSCRRSSLCPSSRVGNGNCRDDDRWRKEVRGRKSSLSSTNYELNIDSIRRTEEKPTRERHFLGILALTVSLTIVQVLSCDCSEGGWWVLRKRNPSRINCKPFFFSFVYSFLLSHTSKGTETF